MAWVELGAWGGGGVDLAYEGPMATPQFLTLYFYNVRRFAGDPLDRW